MQSFFLFYLTGILKSCLLTIGIGIGFWIMECYALSNQHFFDPLFNLLSTKRNSFTQDVTSKRRTPFIFLIWFRFLGIKRLTIEKDLLRIAKIVLPCHIKFVLINFNSFSIAGFSYCLYLSLFLALAIKKKYMNKVRR